jgi:ketosteroid isomerase-like protein/catechol 2,3-dioxygenase-like lactoylglutathione lyase family enzyme
VTADDARARIDAIRIAIQEAENAMDPAAIAQFLQEDAVLMVPDHPVQEGKAACTAFLREMLGQPASRYDRRITYTSDEVAVAGDLAFDRGTFGFSVTPKDGGDTTDVTGKYLWILARGAEEKWLITRLIASRDDSGGEERVEAERAVAILPGDSVTIAREFYVGKLGFRILFEATDDGMNGLLGVERGGLELTIDCPMSGHGRQACVSLRVNDADALYAEWRHVVRIAAPPKDETWGGRTFGFQDPFDNTVFVIGPSSDEA